MKPNTHAYASAGCERAAVEESVAWSARGVGAAEARDVLARLNDLAATRCVSPCHLASVYAGLGQRDAAIDCLERAFDGRTGGIHGVNGSFLFTGLRPHPRFRALLRKMNLL